MKLRLRPAVMTALVLGSVGMFAGCEDGGSKGPDQDYTGTWRGSTSNGGSVSFTVAGGQVTALVIKDPPKSTFIGGGEITLQQVVDIDGDSFSAESKEGYMTKGSLSGKFDSATHCSGKYMWFIEMNGTFEATRQ